MPLNDTTYFKETSNAVKKSAQKKYSPAYLKVTKYFTEHTKSYCLKIIFKKKKFQTFEHTIILIFNLILVLRNTK